jgi:hypothetical protein
VFNLDEGGKMLKYVRFNTGLLIPFALLLAACSPTLATRIAESTTPTPITHNPGVADLLRHPPAPGTSAEVDAYYSGATYSPVPGGFMSTRCPSRRNAALTDRPLLAQVHVLNAVYGNAVPEDAPWLIAAKGEAKTPDPRLADLPYHARLRGHLGNPAFAQCQDAERIFVVEAVVKTYQQEAPEPGFPFSKLPNITWRLRVTWRL